MREHDFDLEATQPIVIISVDLVKDDAGRCPTTCDDLMFPRVAAPL